jgi:hypothetical protein
MVAAKRAAALFVLAIGAGPDPIHVAAEADGEGAVVSPAARLSGRATSGCRWAPSFPVESATSCPAVTLMHHFLTLLDALFRLYIGHHLRPQNLRGKQSEAVSLPDQVSMD